MPAQLIIEKSDSFRKNKSVFDSMLGREVFPQIWSGCEEHRISGGPRLDLILRMKL